MRQGQFCCASTAVLQDSAFALRSVLRYKERESKRERRRRKRERKQRAAVLLSTIAEGQMPIQVPV